MNMTSHVWRDLVHSHCRRHDAAMTFIVAMLTEREHPEVGRVCPLRLDVRDFAHLQSVRSVFASQTSTASMVAPGCATGAGSEFPHLG
jgi:hypothetical protein